MRLYIINLCVLLFFIQYSTSFILVCINYKWDIHCHISTYKYNVLWSNSLSLLVFLIYLLLFSTFSGFFIFYFNTCIWRTLIMFALTSSSPFALMLVPPPVSLLHLCHSLCKRKPAIVVFLSLILLNIMFFSSI
jgi:hypothetical protein